MPVFKLYLMTIKIQLIFTPAPILFCRSGQTFNAIRYGFNIRVYFFYHKTL